MTCGNKKSEKSNRTISTLLTKGKLRVYIRMEFPITRERLQNYRVNEAVLVETKQRVLKEIQVICKDVERTVLTTYETKYIYRIPYFVKGAPLVNTVGFLKELVLAINDTFPDCNVMVDPLETYILIDWS